MATSIIPSVLYNLDALLANQCRSKGIGNREVVRMLFLLRFKNADHVFLLPHSQEGVSQQINCLQVCRLFGMNARQLSHGFGQLSHLVIGQSEIKPDSRLRRQLAQRCFVLRNCFFKLSEPSQCHSQIGVNGSGLRMKFQKLTVLRDGACEIARLLPLHRVLDQLLRRLRKREARV